MSELNAATVLRWFLVGLVVGSGWECGRLLVTAIVTAVRRPRPA